MTEATTQPSTTETHDDDLRAILGRHHHQIGLVLDDLVDAFGADNGPWAAQCFTALEQQLLAHLALEEEHVFPVIERVEPAEVAALRREHADIRTQLQALGIALDLHHARLTRVAAFVETLRAHATREDALAYCLADRHLSATARVRMSEQVRALLTRLAGRARRAGRDTQR